MDEKSAQLRYPHAGLGLVGAAGELRRADGVKAGEMPHGCTACNRQEGRPSAGVTLKTELPLELEGSLALRLVVDYCPRCGRVYDVRCAAAKEGTA